MMDKMPVADDSRFRVVLLMAARARQLQGGATPMLHTLARRNTLIAREEFDAGLLRWELIPAAVV
jgi:DNA-directed RNA polymerase omega subunit